MKHKKLFILSVILLAALTGAAIYIYSTIRDDQKVQATLAESQFVSHLNQGDCDGAFSFTSEDIKLTRTDFQKYCDLLKGRKFKQIAQTMDVDLDMNTTEAHVFTIDPTVTEAQYLLVATSSFYNSNRVVQIYLTNSTGCDKEYGWRDSCPPVEIK